MLGLRGGFCNGIRNTGELADIGQLRPLGRLQHIKHVQKVIFG